MVREARRMAVILDADVVGRARVTTNDESSWMARLAQHRVERLEPVLARHGGRLVELPGGRARAEFPDAVAALGAAIEFQQAAADANRDQPGDSAVVFRLRLHDASEDDAARRVEKREQEREQRTGGIVVSAALRDAVAGRVPASFAELGSGGLGTVERPLHTYEVGWDPADWPAASAAAAWPSHRAGRRQGNRPMGRRHRLGHDAGGGRLSRRGATAAGFCHLARAGRQDTRPCGARAARRGSHGAAPVDSYDGTYAGMATTRPDGRVVVFKLKVTNGVGSGTQIQRECGAAPITLKVSPTGSVTGLALMFSSTCLKTEMAIRGRAVGDTLQLRLGNQHLELSKASD